MRSAINCGDSAATGLNEKYISKIVGKNPFLFIRVIKIEELAYILRKDVYLNC